MMYLTCLKMQNVFGPEMICLYDYYMMIRLFFTKKNTVTNGFLCFIRLVELRQCIISQTLRGSETRYVSYYFRLKNKIQI